jgi:hypothetical protein
MKVGKFLSSYLRAADVTQPVTITVERVVEETVGRPGKSERKLVLHYRGGTKVVVLSKTMLGQLVEILKSDDTDDWAGKRVVMFQDPDVDFEGKRVGGIRFRAQTEI